MRFLTPFLNFNELKIFFRCSVTEPLNRILEPVSVTHLDHSDADYETLKNYRMMDSQKSLDIDDSEREARTQSDGADPGVLGMKKSSSFLNKNTI